MKIGIDIDGVLTDIEKLKYKEKNLGKAVIL